MSVGRIVWVDDWQMQCCGHPFGIGGVVSWTLAPTIDRDFLSLVLGPDAEAVTDAEEHHSDSTTLSSIDGVVAGLEAVYCRYNGSSGSDRGPPIARSAVRRRRDRVDGWEPDDGDLRFVGYLVEVDTPQE